MIESEALDAFLRQGYWSAQIPEQLCDAAISLACRFYKQPLEQRLQISAAKSLGFLGYLPSESEMERNSLKLPRFENERKRGYASFDFTDDPSAYGASGLDCANKWPSDQVLTLDIRKFNQNFRAFTLEIAKKLLGAVELTGGCSLPTGSLEGATCSMTRFLLYEQVAVEGLSKAHTDYEFISAIVSNGPGLEVELADRSWFAVPWNPAECVVLPGDMLSVASKGRIRATRHRVRFGLSERISTICFQGFRYETPIPYPNREALFGEHDCGMKIRGTPHLERAWKDGSLKVPFDVPTTNPLASRGAAAASPDNLR